jgi:hypothetical protein
MRGPQLAFAALMAGTAFGCSSPTSPGQAAPVSIMRFGPSGRALTSFSGYSEPQRFVVRDSATWAMVWETIYQSVSPRPDMPPVDFTRNMVLVVALGTRPTTGWDILLDSAVLGSDGLVVYERLSSAASNTVLPVVTRPVDVGVIPRSTGPVQFVDRF